MNAMPSSASPAPTTPLDLTWKRIIKIWWAFCWRAGLLGLISSFIIGLAAGYMGLALGMDSQTLAGIIAALGTLIGIGTGLIAFRAVLKKKFPDFRIALVPLAGEDAKRR
ncbi:MAG: hypothetical protein WDO70_12385 [Alphaproteobacteria bacterium]